MFGLFKKNYYYNDLDQKNIEKYITNLFGKYDTVIHELISTNSKYGNIHVDIAVIEPTKKHNYYTLVTFGAGAYKMNVPEKYGFSSMEYVIQIPQEIYEDKNKQSYYVKLLQVLARLPITEKSFYAPYHSVDIRSIKSECNLKFPFDGVAYVPPYNFINDETTFFTLSNRNQVVFSQVIVLLNGELELVANNGASNYEAIIESNTDLLTVNENRKQIIK